IGLIGGCGYLGAQASVGGSPAPNGILTGGAPLGYAPGDFVTVSGGTPAPAVTFNGAISATGILTVNSAPSGQLVLGQVITGAGVGNVIFLQNLLTGYQNGSTWQT